MGKFLQPISSWNATGQGGEVGAGTNWAACPWVPGSGAQMSILQANASSRRNSRGDLPSAGPQSCSAPALSRVALEGASLRAQKVRACYPETRAFPRGPNTPGQDALCKLARPLQSRREPRSPQPGLGPASFPPSAPFPERSEGALTGRR